MTVQDDFTSVTWGAVFPLYFCEMYRIEDKCVAEHLLEVWPNITKLVDYYNGFPASKQPSCKSCFSYIAGLLQPFLKIYQTDQPMLPFLFEDLKDLVKTLLTNINPSILEKSKTVKELLDIKLEDQKKNILKTKNVHIGFAATNETEKQWDTGH